MEYVLLILLNKHEENEHFRAVLFANTKFWFILTFWNVLSKEHCLSSRGIDYLSCTYHVHSVLVLLYALKAKERTLYMLCSQFHSPWTLLLFYFECGPIKSWFSTPKKIPDNLPLTFQCIRGVPMTAPVGNSTPQLSLTGFRYTEVLYSKCYHLRWLGRTTRTWMVQSSLNIQC